MSSRIPRRRARGVAVWTLPAARQGQRLTRQQLADAALAVADREGFEAVSMRRLARDLGVGTMSLYRYVQTKDDLVDLMDDAVMGEILVPPEVLASDWRTAMTAIAHATREMFLRHPWAAYSLQQAVPGPNAMRHAEQSLAALADVPLSAVQKLTMLAVVDDYVLGHAIRAAEFAGRLAMDEGAFAEATALGEAELASGRYPFTAALFAGENPGEAMREFVGPDRDRERFDIGLAGILDAFEALFARAPTGSGGGRRGRGLRA